jgi:hypothetical protein
LKQKQLLLVAIRDTRAIVADDANTHIFYPSSEFMKKNRTMRVEAAPNETKPIPVALDHERSRCPSAVEKTRTTPLRDMRTSREASAHGRASSAN